MLCGLLKPSDGKANVAGFDIQKEIVEVKGRIGVVPEISNLYDELTSLENLIFMCQLYGVSKSQRENRAEALLQLFRLEGKRDDDLEGVEGHLLYQNIPEYPPALLGG